MNELPPVSDEDVAAAMRAVRDYFRTSISETQLYEGELRAFFEGLTTESPRALAIVAFSYIDEKLAILMQRHLSPDISGGLNSLFQGFGPLSTASGKLKIAASLRWLTPRTYRHLELLRKIRNEFAHSPFLNSFDDAPVRDFIGQFEPLEKPLWGFMADLLLPYENVSRRQLFHIRATLTCAQMIEEVTAAPLALTMGLSPRALHEDGHDSVPKVFRELLRASLNAVTRIVPKPVS